MGLAKNDDMIQALAADRSDQPFGKAVLLGRDETWTRLPDSTIAQIDPAIVA